MSDDVDPDEVSAAAEATYMRRAREKVEDFDRERRINGVLWRDSDEYRRMNRWTVLLAIALVVLMLAAALVLALVVRSRHDGFPELFVNTLPVPVLIGSGFAAIYWYRQGRRRHFLERQRLGLAERLEEEEREVAESGDTLELADLWALTQRRIDYYHRIATVQAESSFRNGTIAGFVGIGFLIAISVVAALANNLGASVSIGVIGVAGAAMSSYLGATFIRSQTAASAQLQRFFAQPVEFSRLLAAERLIDRLTEQERAEAVRLVLTSALLRGDGGPDEDRRDR